MAGYRAVVTMASTLQWPHGPVLVTLQDTERVGTARLLHADVDADRLAYVLVVTDEVVLSSQWYLTARHLLALYSDDPQLMALSLTAENEVLGETHSLRSNRRRALDETQGEPPVFFWQRPSSALVFAPYAWQELVAWMRLTQAAYPAYHPCVPTLVTNHRNGWQEWVAKWMYERGSYALYTNFPHRSVLAIKDAAADAPDPRYAPTLINVKTYADMRVEQLGRVGEGEYHVFDFHLRRLVSPLPLLSRALVQATAKQCWVMDDWKTDEAAHPNMNEDELSTQADQDRRRAKQKRRHQPPPSPNATSAPQGGPEELGGHQVTEAMIAGVRPLRKAGGKGGKGKRGGSDAWAEAAAAAIAESHERGAQEAVKEQEAKKKEQEKAAAAAPAAAQPPAAPAEAKEANKPAEAAPAPPPNKEAEKPAAPAGKP